MILLRSSYEIYLFIFKKYLC